MLIKPRVLIKGTAVKTWENKDYYSIEVYGIEGLPADLKVDVDIVKQRPLFDQAGKFVTKIVEMVIDVTMFNGKARFHLVSFDMPK